MNTTNRASTFLRIKNFIEILRSQTIKFFNVLNPVFISPFLWIFGLILLVPSRIASFRYELSAKRFFILLNTWSASISTTVQSGLVSMEIRKWFYLPATGAKFLIHAFLLLSLVSCAKIKVHNQTWYGSLQIEGAAQFDTLSSRKDVLTFAQFVDLWNDGNNPLICTRASSFADIQKNYQIICSAYPSECTVDGVENLKRFFTRVKKIGRRNQMLNLSSPLAPIQYVDPSNPIE